MARIGLFILKLFLMLVVTMMIRFQIPELRYDFGTKTPVEIASPNDLAAAGSSLPMLVSVRGAVDFDRAAVCASHGVLFTYFLLTDYGTTLMVRTPEQISDAWRDIDTHVGRLRPITRMPFRRTVRAGFEQNFGVAIPEEAFFLARDDVPKLSGWSIGATVFASTLWCILAYFFFVHGRLRQHSTISNVK